jgi:hypothetical protein
MGSQKERARAQKNPTRNIWPGTFTTLAFYTKVDHLKIKHRTNQIN